MKKISNEEYTILKNNNYKDTFIRHKIEVKVAFLELIEIIINNVLNKFDR